MAGDLGGLRPRVDSVLHDGRSTWDEALVLFLERSGYTEESYHTFSYSPLRDESGDVVGVLCVVSEETQRVVTERRMATLRELGSDPGAVRAEAQFLRFSAEQLARNPHGLPFTLTYLFREDGSARLAASSGIGRDHPAAPDELEAGAAGPWPTARAWRGRTSVIALDDGRFGELSTACGAGGRVGPGRPDRPSPHPCSPGGSSVPPLARRAAK
ncbi:PAS domain-containing protein [Kitasatospora aureofaciens]|uniref:PAS domain-containing protein n=1 Tax=Kitasatospora aureofaciens TaxID=1894 RepID=UPI0033E888AD